MGRPPDEETQQAIEATRKRRKEIGLTSKEARANRRGEQTTDEQTTQDTGTDTQQTPGQ